jgi:hypothetical protein
MYLKTEIFFLYVLYGFEVVSYVKGRRRRMKALRTECRGE